MAGRRTGCITRFRASQASNKEVLHNLASKEGFGRFLHEANRKATTEGVE